MQIREFTIKGRLHVIKAVIDVTSCPEIDCPYVSGARATFIENKDQNIHE
jgi:hypothetical protein